MTKIRTVFFDAGFTLVDLASPVLDVYLGAARDVGAEIDASAFGQSFNRCWMRLEEDYRKRCPELTSSEEIERGAWRSFTSGIAEEFPALLDRHADWHGRLVQHFDDPSAWRPVPDALTTLERLSASGLRMAVVSNWHSALIPILESHGLRKHFSFVLTSAEAKRKKPHRDIFEQALSRLGSTAEETAHVGDSWNDDVEGALGAGLRAIHIHRGSGQPRSDPMVTVIRRLREIDLGQ